MPHEIDAKTGKIVWVKPERKPKAKPASEPLTTSSKAKAPTMDDLGIKSVYVAPTRPPRPTLERMMPEPDFTLADVAPRPALPAESATPKALTPEGSRTGLLDQAELIDMLYNGKVPPLTTPVKLGSSGRPIEYSREVADRVLILATKFTITKLVKMHKTLPSEGLIRIWVLDNVDGFAERFKRARRIFLEGLADDVVDLSDDSNNDTVKNSQSVQRSKLKVESRMWLLAKLRRDLFGNAAEADPAKQNAGGAKENTSDARERLAHLLNRTAAVGRKGSDPRPTN